MLNLLRFRDVADYTLIGGEYDHEYSESQRR